MSAIGTVLLGPLSGVAGATAFQSSDPVGMGDTPAAAAVVTHDISSVSLTFDKALNSTTFPLAAQRSSLVVRLASNNATACTGVVSAGNNHVLVCNNGGSFGNPNAPA